MRYTTVIQDGGMWGGGWEQAWPGPGPSRSRPHRPTTMSQQLASSHSAHHPASWPAQPEASQTSRPASHTARQLGSQAHSLPGPAGRQPGSQSTSQLLVEKETTTVFGYGIHVGKTKRRIENGFHVSCIGWQSGGSRWLQTTPTECGSDLLLL